MKLNVIKKAAHDGAAFVILNRKAYLDFLEPSSSSICSFN